MLASHSQISADIAGNHAVGEAHLIGKCRRLITVCVLMTCNDTILSHDNTIVSAWVTLTCCITSHAICGLHVLSAKCYFIEHCWSGPALLVSVNAYWWSSITLPPLHVGQSLSTCILLPFVLQSMQYGRALICLALNIYYCLEIRPMVLVLIPYRMLALIISVGEHQQ